MTSFGEDTIAWVIVIVAAIAGFGIIISDWLEDLRLRKERSKYKQGEKI